MKKHLIIASIVLASLWGDFARSAPGNLFDGWKIRSAFKNEKGDLIVRFEDDSRLFPSRNTLFYKNRSSLQQIEISMSSDDESAREMGFSDGSISFSNDQATLYCHEKSAEYKSLNDAALTLLAQDIRARKLSIKPLPEIEEPLYLLQVKGSDELVYVTAPKYNFHGNYGVSLVRNGRKTKIETIESPLQQASENSGLIRFKNGGGLYVPGAIDLFLPSAKHRGSPSLFRSKNGKMEELVRPVLSPTQLQRLGIKAPSNARAFSPCDLLQ